MSHPKAKIYTRYQALNNITVQDIRDMFKVFCRYYDNVALDQFVTDLGKKTGAFGVYRMQVDGQEIKGVFSGDTVLEKEHWGHRAINAAFVKRVLWEAIKNPMTPQYWFLISKGYKTFLLLSRNFPEYYPHPTQKN